MLDPMVFKVLKNGWNSKRSLISHLGYWKKDDLVYYCPGAGVVFDYGLVYDFEPFKWKLPVILMSLWYGTQNDSIKIVNDCIDFERKKLSLGGISDQELMYIIYIKNIANYVITHKFCASDKERRKVIGGDLNGKTHFTIL
jgi:hypothetical protein